MDILATVTFEAKSGLPEDRTVTQFPLSLAPASLDSQADADALATTLIEFWTTPGVGGLDEWIGNSVSRAVGPTVRFYDITGHLNGSPHGSPIFTSVLLPIGGASFSGDYPRELAVVLTTRATNWELANIEVPDNADPDDKPQRPRQRLSGRMFIGPLRDGAGEQEIGSGEVRVAAGLRTRLLAAANTLKDDLAAEHGALWSVWSRANQSLSTVTHVQVDNAFDIQRRRGLKPTVRQTQLV